MHEFNKDFYGDILKIVLLGQIRRMTTFENKRKRDYLLDRNRIFLNESMSIRSD